MLLPADTDVDPAFFSKSDPDLDTSPNRTLAELSTIVACAKIFEQWQDLADHAAEPNPFYAPGYALAAAQHLPGQCKVEVVLVWASGARTRLIGLFPLARRTGLRGFFAAGWMTPYFVCAAPLVRLGAEKPALDGFLSWAQRGDAPATLLLDQLDAHGPLLPHLSEAFARAGLLLLTTNRYRRAELRLDPSAALSLSHHVGKKRLKNLRRRWRKLSSLGQLRFAVFQTREEVAKGVEMFLALEAKGWKGAKGSALLCTDETLQFARAAFTARNGNHATRCEVLLLDGRPLAVSIHLIAQDCAVAIKAAYDEEFRAFAPGLLLDFAALQASLETPWVRRIDSAALPGHVLEGLWADRRETVQVLLGLRPTGANRALSQLIAALFRLKPVVKARLRQVLRRSKS